MADNSNIIEFLKAKYISFEREVDFKVMTWIKSGGAALL